LEETGAFAVVLEGVPAALAAKITAKLKIPTIGIGAGAGCGGQVQVVHDILGLFEEFVPKHTKAYANLAGEIRRAVAAYAADVKSGKFPGKAQSW
jgi:3-methyl-2-oxobutanoate hydroxymethyltransferase